MADFTGCTKLKRIHETRHGMKNFCWLEEMAERNLERSTRRLTYPLPPVSPLTTASRTLPKHRSDLLSLYSHTHRSQIIVSPLKRMYNADYTRQPSSIQRYLCGRSFNSAVNASKSKSQVRRSELLVNHNGTVRLLGHIPSPDYEELIPSSDSSLHHEKLLQRSRQRRIETAKLIQRVDHLLMENPVLSAAGGPSDAALGVPNLTNGCRFPVTLPKPASATVKLTAANITELVNNQGGALSQDMKCHLWLNSAFNKKLRNILKS